MKQSLSVVYTRVCLHMVLSTNAADKNLMPFDQENQHFIYAGGWQLLNSLKLKFNCFPATEHYLYCASNEQPRNCIQMLTDHMITSPDRSLLNIGSFIFNDKALHHDSNSLFMLGYLEEGGIGQEGEFGWGMQESPRQRNFRYLDSWLKHSPSLDNC